MLEDTFDIDLKFFNTYGPSKTFYYNIPASQNYKVRVAIKHINVYKVTENESDERGERYHKIANVLDTENYIVTPKDIDELIDIMTEIITDGINKAM